MKDRSPILVWFRSDLRLSDNPALDWGRAGPASGSRVHLGAGGRKPSSYTDRATTPHGNQPHFAPPLT